MSSTADTATETRHFYFEITDEKVADLRPFEPREFVAALFD